MIKYQFLKIVMLNLAKVRRNFRSHDRHFNVPKTKLSEPLTERLSSESGNAILSVLVAIGIFGILSTNMTTTNNNSMKASKAVSYRQDLETIRKTISSRLDCKQTLNITPGSTLPLSCKPRPQLRLKRMDGNPIGSNPNKIGDWTVKAVCEGSELIIKATNPGSDPLTGRPLNDTSSNATGTKVSDDLFGGSSDFCRSFYDLAATSCSGTYDIYKGSRRGNKLCCRKISHTPGPPSYTAQPNCNSNEWAMTGGGECIYDGVLSSSADPSFLHVSHMAGSGWGVDCFNASGSSDAGTVGFAICCPN
ncbi:MAG: hypothetical protein H7318_04615 [Oligoflexus sp.]|nr:hypothetical protein [Oligoflexus sp.]